MKRKRVTVAVLRGIRAACHAALAGPIGDGGDFDDQDGLDMQAALDWTDGQDVRDVEMQELRSAFAKSEDPCVIRDDERARIVAWFRSRAAESREEAQKTDHGYLYVEEADRLDSEANRIERGEYRDEDGS